MNEDYNFSAYIYDPMLYLVLRPVRKVVLNELMEHKDKAILDLCCGTGNQLKFLSKNGFSNLHCLDLSEAMLRVAQQGNFPIKIYHQDAAKTNFEDAVFDVVMLSFAVHEKDRETQESMLDEAYRLLKEDAFILIVDFVFDDKTKKMGSLGIRLIEKMAGGEHYSNFKKYIQNNGLASLVKEDKFKFIKNHRMAFNGVTVSKYQKI
ncbi:MAG: class I SAM-dependent methyltransferase [Anaerolineales bacterium]|nr:class I SAM-dependent methyltransferase [Anaerolineales bacterium]